MYYLHYQKLVFQFTKLSLYTYTHITDRSLQTDDQNHQIIGRPTDRNKIGRLKDVG